MDCTPEYHAGITEYQRQVVLQFWIAMEEVPGIDKLDVAVGSYWDKGDLSRIMLLNSSII